MNVLERIQDIKKTGNFSKGELKLDNPRIENIFKSYEYYAIIHYTDSEYYYQDDQSKEQLERLGKEIHTEKGIIFCFE